MQIVEYWRATYDKQKTDCIEFDGELDGTWEDRKNAIGVDFYKNHPTQKNKIKIPLRSEHYPGYSLKVFDENIMFDLQDWVLNNADNIVWKEFDEIYWPYLGEELMERFTAELKTKSI